MSEENLYPVYYEGKRYFEKDCDEMFLCFYHTVHALNGDRGVYMFEDVWVYPDGSTS